MVVKVEISADVYLVCLVQALSTEKEEVMGLLIGEVRFKPSAEVMQRLHFGPGLRLGSLYSQIKRAPLSLCCTELSLSCCIVKISLHWAMCTNPHLPCCIVLYDHV